MRELRSALSEMRLADLAVGSDGRNRTILSAFQSRTGRCQPSNTKYIFGPSVWLRGLIQPPEGWGVAYLDWSQQEHGIAAVLSGDAAMQAAYLSGDPYLEFAKQAGAVPADATKKTHSAERELFKQCVLAVAYGMEAKSLAQRIGQPEIVARDLLRSHRETYRKFWAWSDATVDRAMLLHPLLTVFGWPIRIGSDPNPRSLRNFPCQANGAEMLRLAACFATEQGIEVCALIHDAVLIAAPLDQLDHDIERMKAAMAKASRVVLDGFELRTDVNVVRYPDRYQDPRGAVMWQRVMKPGGETRSGKAGGGVMDDQDDIGIERLRVDPALMQQVLEQQAAQVEAEGLAADLHRGAEGVGAAAAGSQTDQHLPPGDRAAVPALVRQGQADHRFQQGGEGGEDLRPIEMESPRRAGTAGPDRGGSQAAQGAARRPAPHPGTENMERDRAQSLGTSAPKISGNMDTIAPKGSLFSFLVLSL